MATPTRYVRVNEIVGNKKANPPIPPILPISRSHWLQLVKDGEAPKPIKLSEKCTCWRLSDVLAFAEKGATSETPT